MTTISDAQGVQMWATGQQVYNEQDPDYVDKPCYNQEFKCTEDMRFQIRESDPTKDYFLRIKNAKTGELLQTLPYVKTPDEVESSLEALQFENKTFDVNMSSWHNWEEDNDVGEDWDDYELFSWFAGLEAIGSLPDAAIYQKRATKWPAGNYTVKIIALNASSGGSTPFDQTVRVCGSNNGFGVSSDIEVLEVLSDGWDRTGLFEEKLISFTLTEETEGLGFVFFKLGSSLDSEISFRVSNIEFTEVPETMSAGAIYDLSFVPSTYGLCDSKVVFEVADEDGIVIFTSDGVLLSSQPRANLRIQYKSNKPFASLFYTAETGYFSFRIEGRFFKERSVTEQDVLALSNNLIINTGSQLKRQRALVVGYMPDYMHNKLIIALQHAVSGSLKINNGIDEYEWTIENDYEPIESQSEKYAEQASRIWLTRKNYLLTNVI